MKFSMLLHCLAPPADLWNAGITPMPDSVHYKCPRCTTAWQGSATMCGLVMKANYCDIISTV